jgi:hypothetical protein
MSNIATRLTWIIHDAVGAAVLGQGSGAVFGGVGGAAFGV